MRQRWLFNLVLLGVAFILSISIFYTMEQEDSDKQPNLIDLATNRVQSIRIQKTENDRLFFLKNTQGLWKMTSPYQLSANQFRIERLLKLLSENDYTVMETAKLNLSAVNLKPPLLTIKFNQIVIDFGDPSPLDDGKRYLLIDGKAYLVKETIFNHLQDEAFNFINLSVLGNSPKITELILPDIHLLYQENKWVITETTIEKVDSSADKLNAFISNWQNAQAFTVEAYELPEPMQSQIKIYLSDKKEPIKLEAVLTKELFILGWQEKGIQYQLPIRQHDKLLHLPLKEEVIKADSDSGEDDVK